MTCVVFRSLVCRDARAASHRWTPARAGHDQAQTARTRPGMRVQRQHAGQSANGRTTGGEHAAQVDPQPRDQRGVHRPSKPPEFISLRRTLTERPVITRMTASQAANPRSVRPPYLGTVSARLLTSGTLSRYRRSRVLELLSEAPVLTNHASCHAARQSWPRTWTHVDHRTGRGSSSRVPHTYPGPQFSETRRAAA